MQALGLGEVGVEELHEGGVEGGLPLEGRRDRVERALAQGPAEAPAVRSRAALSQRPFSRSSRSRISGAASAGRAKDDRRSIAARTSA